MKLIGAGYGRSGTMSLQEALEILGLGPCYHMKISMWRFWHLNFFLRAWHGKKVNWKRFYSNYNSVVDWPTCVFYKELMEVYPDAKILLNVRDPEKWYDSMYETIWAIQPVFPFWFPPVVRRFHKEVIWSTNFRGQFPDKEATMKIYKEYIEEVKQTVPADRLLVYDVKQGWSPLCQFLGVPIPDRPFPNKNDRKSFQRMIATLKVLNWLVPVLVVLLISLLLLLSLL